jgi:hypothetical protein
MIRQEELTVKIGGIADLISAIEKAKSQLKADVDKLYADKSRVQQWRDEQIESYKKMTKTKIDELRSEIAENLAEIAEYAGRPFDFTQKTEIDAKIDYLVAMHNAECLSSGMVTTILDEYKGHEAVLLYMRQKLTAAGINEHHFDSRIFGTFDREPITGKVKYTPGSQFFRELNDTIARGTSLPLTLHGLNQLQEILGVESTGVKNLTAEVEARAVEHPPVM